MSEDFTSMSNPKFLYRAGLHHPFPAWVASEAMPEKQDFEKKASAAFADPARRLLPICSPTAAFHSALNILAHPDSFEVDAFERVKEACEGYGIVDDLAPYVELFAGDIVKEATAEEGHDGRFAIDTEVGGELFRILPLNDGEDVIASAFDLAKMAAEQRLPFPMFVPAAREIVKAAHDHSVKSLPLIVSHYGESRFYDADRAAKLIEGRAQLCKDATLHEVLPSYYAEALKDAETDPDTAMEKISAIDTAVGLSVNYKPHSKVPNPYDIVFCGGLESEVEKVATAHVLVRDVLLPLTEVVRIPSLEAEYLLSKEAADEFQRLRDTGDARDLSLAVERWEEEDQKTLLRLTVASAA